MAPHLNPDLYLLIAQHIKRSSPVHDRTIPAVEKAINVDQDALSNLMKTSKALYDLCARELYKDCAPDNFVTFAAGLGTNKNIDRTTRLHIHHKRHWAEVTYSQIFECGWHWLEVKNTVNDLLEKLDADSAAKERKALVCAGLKLRKSITRADGILPGLLVVSMGGIGEKAFNKNWSVYFEQQVEDFEDTSKLLPHALIDLSTVQHYCQAVVYGPLALPNKILKVKSPLQIFTCHHRGTDMLSRNPIHQRNRSPPIILGAVNRYYCGAAGHIPFPLSDEIKLEVPAIIAMIVAMFNRPVTFADPTTGRPVELSNEHHQIEGTVLEIYDFFRTIDISRLDDSGRACADPDDCLQALPARSLAYLQETLDQALPLPWKGKVWLRNREEAPPCSACGLDLQAEFKSNEVIHHAGRAAARRERLEKRKEVQERQRLQEWKR